MDFFEALIRFWLSFPGRVILKSIRVRIFFQVEARASFNAILFAIKAELKLRGKKHVKLLVADHVRFQNIIAILFYYQQKYFKRRIKSGGAGSYA